MATQAKFDLTQLNGSWSPGGDYTVEIPAGLVIETGNNEASSKAETKFFTISQTPPVFLRSDLPSIEYYVQNLGSWNGKWVDSTTTATAAAFRFVVPSLPIYSIINTATSVQFYEIANGGSFPTSSDTLMATTTASNCFFGTTSTYKGITNLYIPFGNQVHPDTDTGAPRGLINYLKQGWTYYVTADAGVLSNGYLTTSSVQVNYSTPNIYKLTWDKAIIGMTDRTFYINDENQLFATNSPRIGLVTNFDNGIRGTYTIQFSSDVGEFGFYEDGSDRSSTWSRTSSDAPGLNILMSNLRFWPTENVTSGTFTYTQIYNSSTVATITKNLTGIISTSTSSVTFATITSSTNWTPPYKVQKYSSVNWKASVILVGGGGSGWSNTGTIVLGGGGAGGVRTVSNVTITNTSYSITVGLGGRSGSNTSYDGQNTVAFGYTSNGGFKGDTATVKGGKSGLPTQYNGYSTQYNVAAGSNSGAGSGGYPTSSSVGGVGLTPIGFLGSTYAEGGSISTGAGDSLFRTTAGSGGTGRIGIPVQDYPLTVNSPGLNGVVVIKITK